ncbi:MAG: hypothetical protein IJF88_02510 [Oscillospiraceae bacterium]|nr:hypothetical protein [Oscillospiraceae bacterium]MBQ6122985.1 hypothetical protein [Clostridia bacterium]
MTVKDLWLHTGHDIYLDRGENAAPLKLPTAGRLQAEHAGLLVVSIDIRTRSMEPPYLLVKAAAPEDKKEENQ